MSRGRFGISPVVATVILVAVAIVIAIAVAFWASGLVGIFTRFEKLEIVSAVMTDQATFEVTVKNTGSADAAITQVVINGKFIGVPGAPIALKVGEQRVLQIAVNPPPPPGITVEISLSSAAGKTYPTAVLATLGTGQGPWEGVAVTVQGKQAGGGGGTTQTTTTTPGNQTGTSQ
jgi:hypothetical protein